MDKYRGKIIHLFICIFAQSSFCVLNLMLPAPFERLSGDAFSVIAAGSLADCLFFFAEGPSYVLIFQVF
jgi:hypothetical protein